MNANNKTVSSGHKKQWIETTYETWYISVSLNEVILLHSYNLHKIQIYLKFLQS